MTRAIVVLAVVFAAAVAAAEQNPAAPVFTARQATAGKTAYDKNCASCHMPDLSGNNEIPQLAGKTFVDTWGSRTTKELFDYMSAAMPYGGPALDTDSYRSIAAYILQTNGATAGEQEFTVTTSAPIGSLMPATGTVAGK